MLDPLGFLKDLGNMAVIFVKIAVTPEPPPKRKRPKVKYFKLPNKWRLDTWISIGVTFTIISCGNFVKGKQDAQLRPESSSSKSINSTSSQIVKKLIARQCREETSRGSKYKRDNEKSSLNRSVSRK